MTPAHDVIHEEDGWVRCRCGASFSDNTTAEAAARHRRHWLEEKRKDDPAYVDGIAASRAEIARALLRHREEDL